MKIARCKTEKYHNWDLEPSSKQPDYFKKGFWKRNDRKKFFKRFIKDL